jgi:hypothetical protein
MEKVMKKKIELYRLTEDLKHLRKGHEFEEYVLDDLKDKVIAQNDFMRIYDKSYFEGKLEKIGEKLTVETVYFTKRKNVLMNEKTFLEKKKKEIEDKLANVENDLKKINLRSIIMSFKKKALKKRKLNDEKVSKMIYIEKN